MSIIQDLEELKLPYGTREIKVNALMPGCEDSNFSNEVKFISAPRITVKNETLSVYNLNSSVSELEIHIDGELVDIKEHNPTSEISPKIIALDEYNLSDGKHSFCVKALGSTIEPTSSNMCVYWVGTPVFGVNGQYGYSGSTLTRTDSAVGLIANAGVDSQVVVNDFDNCYPWNEMIEQTDNKGNVFISIPKFYTSYTQETDGGFTTRICKNKLNDTYKLNPIFIDITTSVELEYFLFGKYTVSGTSSLTKSVSGASPLEDVTISDFRIACRNNGAGYQQFDVWALKCVQTLFEIEFATTDSQSIMRGFVCDGKGEHPLVSGTTDNVLAHSGSSSSNIDGNNAMKYRGIENLWGNISYWLDGILIENKKPYVCEDPTKYGNDFTQQGYKMISYDLLYSSGMESYGKLGFDSNNPFVQLPISGGTAYPDSYYADGQSNRAIYVGGSGEYNWAGLWHLCSGATFLDKSIGLGCRLLYKPI